MTKKTVRWILAIGALAGMLNTSFALEVRRTYEHYLINPQNSKDVFKEMQKKGPYVQGNKGRAVAQYQFDIDFLDKLTYREQNNTCDINLENPTLDGTLILYRLDPRGYYSEETVATYEARYQSSKEHELTHERIYKEELHRLERYIKLFSEDYKGNCKLAKTKVKTFYKEALARMEYRNTQFDCEAYGISKGYSECAPYVKDKMLAKKNTSNYPDTSKVKRTQSVRLEQINEKDQEEACEGELIEPFKGKAYCHYK